MNGEQVVVYISGCDDSQYLRMEGLSELEVAVLERLAAGATVQGGGCTPSITVGKEAEEYLDDMDDLTSVAPNGRLRLRSEVWNEETDEYETAWRNAKAKTEE